MQLLNFYRDLITARTDFIFITAIITYTSETNTFVSAELRTLDVKDAEMFQGLSIYKINQITFLNVKIQSLLLCEQFLNITNHFEHKIISTPKV